MIFSGYPLQVIYLILLHGYIWQNLCVAAAYRPVQELLEEERKVRELSNLSFLIDKRVVNTRKLSIWIEAWSWIQHYDES